MRPKHKDPRAERTRRQQNGQMIRTWAHAPYNFVQLPDVFIPVDEPSEQDSYSHGFSGYIDLKITTLSPTYIRGMVDKDLYNEIKNKSARQVAKDVELKTKLAAFYSLSEKDRQYPCIPGSSLRGMLRNLVEIVSFSRIHAVAKDPQIWYRDVAGTGAMRNNYSQSIGAHGEAVRAGFLIKKGDTWQINPARLPGPRFTSNSTYFQVHNDLIEQEIGKLPGFISMYQQGYKLQAPYHVRFNASIAVIHHGNEINKVTNIAAYDGNVEFHDYPYSGWLLTSGNMALGNPQNVPHKRKWYAVVLEADPQADMLKIDEKAVESYLSNLTDTVRDELGERGCLQNDSAIFYSTNLNKNGNVFYFGHNPFFRVPLMSAAFDPITPYDHVPQHLKHTKEWDLVEALFGNEADDGKESRASRVSVMDAKFDLQSSVEEIWYDPQNSSHALRVLGTPKPTAYAHYLVQDFEADPNTVDRNQLSNYSTSADKTEIRGHKAYWTKGDSPSFTEQNVQRERLHTRANPLNPGVVFFSRIYFNSLNQTELGALLWALTLTNKPGQSVYHCHRIGMGKPYGMGAIHIEPTLHYIDHARKYQDAFKRDEQGKLHWYPSARLLEITKFTDNFENIIKKALQFEGSFCDHPRICELLQMHTWRPQVDNVWRNETEYMELDKFRELAVLPSPLGVLNHAQQVRDQPGGGNT